MSMFGPGQLTDGLGWGLSGRAGRSWNSVTVVGAAQTVNANGSLALSLCSWHTVSRANKGTAKMELVLAAPPGSAPDYVVVVKLRTAVSGPGQG